MIANILFTTLGTIAATFASEPACQPFRVHLQADLPTPPPHLENASPEEKRDACVAYYLSLDTNGNGVADWTTDQRHSGILYPNDDDIDGDGIANALDPKPLTPQSAPLSRAANGVPSHLAMKNERGRVQGRIYRDFGIIAIDHSDRHALRALRALEDVLRYGFTPEAKRKITSVKYVYAFAGHDAVVNIAAYHREAKAISIGGARTYRSGGASETERIQLMASIAHELGHAFLFDEIGPAELGEIGIRFGGWRPVIGDSVLQSLVDDERVFLSHPLRALAQAGGSVNSGVWREANMVSEYAATNLHEWFAEAFAAATLSRLAQKKIINAKWDALLALASSRQEENFWIDYAYLSPSFRIWLNHRGERKSRSRPE